MVINGQKATACFGGLGTFVSRGENRVNDLECHANCLRERLDRLEAMLPTALIEASIAVQKGERPPDLLQLTQAEGTVEEPRENEGSAEPPCGKSECGQVANADDMIDEVDEPRVCMLQVLARKEKRLRKKIYEMELKEERYRKALVEAGHTLGEATEPPGIKKSALPCQPECPGSKNQTLNACRAAKTCGDPVKQRIQELEASSKKISMNLKNLHKEKAELTSKARNLTAELRCTQKCLGEVQQRVLGSSPSEVIPIMGDPSLDCVLEKFGPRCAKAGNCALRIPQDPEALKTLAGQFNEAYKRAENEGLSSSFREPIRKTAERLRALSNLDPNSCPCGQPIKCDSCVICSCADWESDLDGGGDEQPDGSSSDSGETSRRIPARKHKKESNDGCRCGCNDTSSESECPCGCSDMKIGTADICPCSCEQAVESSAISTSDPSTITETTIPSSETDDSGYSQVGKGDALCDECDFTGCASLCAFCKIEDQEKSGGNKDQCKICRCETFNQDSGPMCTVCPCVCTTCDVVEERRSPPCQMCKPIITEVTPSPHPVECTCVLPEGVPPGIQKVCRVEKLREGLENLKNRNHVLRDILKSRGCLSPTEDSTLSASPGDKEDCECPRAQNHLKQTPSGLICTVRLLQSKCRTKDGMILALADALKRGAAPEQTSRILESLADPRLICDPGVSDFDRSELWSYLRSTKTRVSGRQTCHRDLCIGLMVLFLITLSHVLRSYSGLPPFPDVVNTMKYWMDEIPGNLRYLTNVIADFARILFQKQCFVSLVHFLGPFSKHFEPIVRLFWSLPGVRTLARLGKIVSLHVDSSCRTFALLAQSLKNLRAKFCTQLCRIVEYLNVFRRLMLFRTTHLPSLEAAVRNSISCCPVPRLPQFCHRMSSASDFLPDDLTASLFSFAKVFISHVLCLFTFIVASSNHLSGIGTFVIYVISCVIRVPAYVQMTLERIFEFVSGLMSRCGIYERILPFVSKFLSNLSTLIESCCCSGANSSNCGIREANSSRLVDYDLRGIEHGIELRVLNDAIDKNVQSQTDLGVSEDPEEPNCECRINEKPKHPEPPRKLKVKGRVSGDGLIISWLPPLSGPVAGYEILAEGEIVGRIRTPLRTETFVGGLDLRGMVLLEVRTISTNGLRSVTVEKLFNPARSDV